MPIANESELKDILKILAATYAAYYAFSLFCDEENKKPNRKRKKRKVSLNDSVSQSASNKYECEALAFVDVGNALKKEQFGSSPKSNVSVESLKISNPRTIDKTKSSGSTAITNVIFMKSFVSKYSDNEFKKHFRVSRKTVTKLTEMFAKSRLYKHTQRVTASESTPAECYILMFLWFAGNKCSMLELSQVFSVSEFTSVAIVNIVIKFLNNCAADYIRFPETHSEKWTCAERFQEHCTFPDVIGCLINTYIVSSEEGSSRKDEISTVQAICDSSGCFIDVYIEPRQQIHCTQMLQNSPINRRLKVLCKGRYHVLAEEEHLVREWLLTPYDEPFSEAQILYNEKHKVTFRGVSDSLKALKWRFQQLTNLYFTDELKIREIIVACCVLQNICLGEGDFFEVSDCDPLVETSTTEAFISTNVVDDSHLRKIGELKRQQLMEHFKNK